MKVLSLRLAFKTACRLIIGASLSEPQTCRMVPPMIYPCMRGKVEIIADHAAGIQVLTKSSRECTKQFLIDDDVLKKEGITVTSHLMLVYWVRERERERNFFQGRS